MADDQPPELDSRPQSRREWTGYLTSLVLPLAFLVVVIGTLVYLQTDSSGGAPDDDEFGSVELPADRNPTGESPDPSVGRAAPDFLLPRHEGEPLRLSDLQGAPLIVTFWASWCSGCRADLPLLAAAQEEHRADGLRVLGINLGEAEERIEAFKAGFDVPFEVLLDRRGEVAETWRIDGPNNGLPATYFLDRTGVIRAVHQGPLSPADVDQALSLIVEGE